MDSVAYLCDWQKGGATVTATALQRLEFSNILWLAANEGISKDTKTYAETILRKLMEIDSKPHNTARDDIYKLAIEKCTPRLQFYNGELQKYATYCRMQLRQEIPNNNGVVLAGCNSFTR